MSISYNGIWGYSALLISLANTKEPLYLGLLGANRPSHKGVVDYFDRAISLCRKAGFKEIRLRDDTDYALTSQFDRFDEGGVKLVVGLDARTNLIERAESCDEEMYHELVTRPERAIATTARTRPHNVKDDIVRERNYKVLRQKAEDVIEFSYRPGKCTRDYRVVALRKNISVMTMATLAWSLKAWYALLLPVSPRWAERYNEQRRRLLTMEFHTFVAAFINIPAQIVKTGRRVRWRSLAYNPWLGPFFRLVDTL